MLTIVQTGPDAFAIDGIPVSAEIVELLAARQARIQETQRHLEDLRKQRVLAENRAKTLLIEFLSPSQVETFTNNKYFDVMSDLSNRWRITTETYSGNLYLMVDNETDSPNGSMFRGRYCAHAPGRLGPLSDYTDRYPAHDHHLTQMLALQTDEKAVIDVAVLQERALGFNVPMRASPKNYFYSVIPPENAVVAGWQAIPMAL